MFAQLSMLDPTSILVATVIILLLLALAVMAVRRTPQEDLAQRARERAARRPMSRPAKPVDPWSPVPYEPEALNRTLPAEQVKPPPHKPWQPHERLTPEEQARIEARVQDQQSLFLGRAIAREVEVSETEFGRLFPNIR